MATLGARQLRARGEEGEAKVDVGGFLPARRHRRYAPARLVEPARRGGDAGQPQLGSHFRRALVAFAVLKGARLLDRARGLLTIAERLLHVRQPQQVLDGVLGVVVRPCQAAGLGELPPPGCGVTARRGESAAQPRRILERRAVAGVLRQGRELVGERGDAPQPAGGQVGFAAIEEPFGQRAPISGPGCRRQRLGQRRVRLGNPPQVAQRLRQLGQGVGDALRAAGRAEQVQCRAVVRFGEVRPSAEPGDAAQVVVVGSDLGAGGRHLARVRQGAVEQLLAVAQPSALQLQDGEIVERPRQRREVARALEIGARERQLAPRRVRLAEPAEQRAASGTELPHELAAAARESALERTGLQHQRALRFLPARRDVALQVVDQRILAAAGDLPQPGDDQRGLVDPSLTGEGQPEGRARFDVPRSGKEAALQLRDGRSIERREGEWLRRGRRCIRRGRCRCRLGGAPLRAGRVEQRGDGERERRRCPQPPAVAGDEAAGAVARASAPRLHRLAAEVPPQVGGEVLHRAVAVARLLAQGAQADGIEVGAEPWRGRRRCRTAARLLDASRGPPGCGRRRLGVLLQHRPLQLGARARRRAVGAHSRE